MDSIMIPFFRHDLLDLLDSSLDRQFPDETGETQSACGGGKKYLR